MKFNDQIFKDCITTLKETSKETHGGTSIEYLCNSDWEVQNFDEMTKIFAKNELKMQVNSKTDETIPKSVDAFRKSDNTQILIEFKDCKINGSKLNEVKLKIFDSIMTLISLQTNENLYKFKEQSKFVLVYSKNKNRDGELRSQFNRDGRLQNILDSLSGFEGYFEKIRLLDEEQFEKLLKNSTKNNWEEIYQKL